MRQTSVSKTQHRQSVDERHAELRREGQYGAQEAGVRVCRFAEAVLAESLALGGESGMW